LRVELVLIGVDGGCLKSLSTLIDASVSFSVEKNTPFETASSYPTTLDE